MPYVNYLKCLNGVPVQPITVTLDSNYFPSEADITWVAFDPITIPPIAVRDTLSNGKVVLDQTKKTAWDTEQTLVANRMAAHASMQTSVEDKLKALGLTAAEAKLATGRNLTDTELGL